MATKEEKEHYLLPIFIGLFIVIVFGGLFGVTLNDINKSMNKKIYMNNIIENNLNKEGKTAYLKITSISQKFAKSGKKRGYYFVSDDNYKYIVLLDNKTAKKIMETDLEKEPITITGITKKTSNDLKELALNEYNYGFDENEQISVSEYYSYFGDIYLEQTLALN